VFTTTNIQTVGKTFDVADVYHQLSLYRYCTCEFVCLCCFMDVEVAKRTRLSNKMAA